MITPVRWTCRRAFACTMKTWTCSRIESPTPFRPQHLILVTNQFGNHKVSVYALGHLKPGRTINDIAGSKGVVTQGTTTQPATGVGAPLPDQRE